MCPSGARSSTKSRLTCSWTNRTLQRWWISWTCIYLSKVSCKGSVEASAWSDCLPKDVELFLRPLSMCSGDSAEKCGPGNLRATGIWTEWASLHCLLEVNLVILHQQSWTPFLNTHFHTYLYVMVVSSNSIFLQHIHADAGNRWNNWKKMYLSLRSIAILLLLLLLMMMMMMMMMMLLLIFIFNFYRWMDLGLAIPHCAG